MNETFLNEPLLHFLLLGALLFAAYSLMATPVMSRRKIVITQGQLASMTESFILTRQRAAHP